MNSFIEEDAGRLTIATRASTCPVCKKAIAKNKPIYYNGVAIHKSCGEVRKYYNCMICKENLSRSQNGFTFKRMTFHFDCFLQGNPDHAIADRVRTKYEKKTKKRREHIYL